MCSAVRHIIISMIYSLIHLQLIFNFIFFCWSTIKISKIKMFTVVAVMLLVDGPYYPKLQAIGRYVSPVVN